MKVCDNCQSPDDLENVSVQIATNEKRYLGYADLCPSCIADIVKLISIDLTEHGPLSPGIGANIPQVPIREKHPAES